MKKTISLIYRIAYIIFFIVALFTKVNYDISKLDSVIYSFTLICDTLSAVAVLACIIFEIKGTHDGIISKFKMICTFLSLVLVIMNYDLILGYVNNQWILSCLLPVMMIFDFIIFEKKAKLVKLISKYFKALFICLSLFAFYKKFGLDLPGFFKGLCEFSNLFNFLTLLFMILSFLYLLFNLRDKNTSVTEIEAFLLTGIITQTVIGFLSFNKPTEFFNVIFVYILPVMLLIDYIFFVPKAKIKGYMPLIFALIVIVLYSVQEIILKEFSFLPLLIRIISVPIASSYLLFAINALKKK